MTEPRAVDLADATPQAQVGGRIGPIRLQPGVTPKEIFFYLCATMGLAFAVTFANLMQPVILGDQLRVPTQQQGVLTGALATTQQLAVLLVIGFAGVMTDRLGRRIVMMAAMAGFALCLLLYPFVTSIVGLFAIRFLWGVASSAHTAGGATKMMDYPAEDSRGKFISLVTIVYAGLIAVYNGYFASHLASWYRNAGMADAEATRWAFWTIALVTVAGLASTLFFMQDDRPARPKTPQPRQWGETWRASKAVLSHARDNKRFAAVLLIASVIRTDGAVMMAFLGLWVLHASREAGIDSIEALKTVGLLLAVQNIVSLCTAPFFGWLSDKVDRLKMLICSLVVMGLAFCSLGLVEDVFSPWMIVLVAILGLAESAQSLTANALLGEVAPKPLRGASMAVFTWVGVASVLLINLTAGVLFDRVGPSAPFVMEGVLCLTIFGAVLLLVRHRPET